MKNTTKAQTGNRDFSTRGEQLALLANPRTAHLAKPAPGADPELERMLAEHETARVRPGRRAILAGMFGFFTGGKR